MGIVDKVKDALHTDKDDKHNVHGNNSNQHSSGPGGVSSQTFTQSGPGSANSQPGINSNTPHGTLGSGPAAGGGPVPGNTGANQGGAGGGIGNISGSGQQPQGYLSNQQGSTGLGSSDYSQQTQQANSGGPPGLQDYLGQNASAQGGLAAQAAGGPGAPGQPGQVSGGYGSSGPTYPAQQGGIGGPQQGLGGQQGGPQGAGFGGQAGGQFGQPGSINQGNQGF